MQLKRKITKSEEKLIVDYFLTQDDNRITTISKNFGFTKAVINRTIDEYFNN